MLVAIYNENCVRAGRAVGDAALEQASVDNDGQGCDPWENGDWTLYNGTPMELRDMAGDIKRSARGGGGGQFDRRVAATILEAIHIEGQEDPDDEEMDTDADTHIPWK